MATGVTYTVKTGDNLATIAKQFYGNERMFAEIMRLNNLTSGMIKSGMVLRMPMNKPGQDISISQGLMTGMQQENNNARQAAGLPVNATGVFGQGAPMSSFVTPKTTVTSLDTLRANQVTGQQAMASSAAMRGRGYVHPRSTAPISQLGPAEPKGSTYDINLPNLQYNVGSAQRQQQQAAQERRMREAGFTINAQIPGGSGMGGVSLVPSQIPGGSGMGTNQDIQNLYKYGDVLGLNKYAALPQGAGITFKGGRAYNAGGQDITQQVTANNEALRLQNERKAMQSQLGGTGTKFYTDWGTVENEAQADSAKKARIDKFIEVVANPGTTLSKDVALAILSDWNINPTTVAGKKMVDQLAAVTPGLSYSPNQAATNAAINNINQELWNIGMFGTPPVQMQVQNGSTGGGGNASGYGDIRYGGGITSKGY